MDKYGLYYTGLTVLLSLYLLYFYLDKHSYAPKEEYTIRIPIEVIQRTKKDGTVHPLIFYWHDNTNEMPIKVKINRIISITPQHEWSSGTVGDRYEVDVGGIRELIYYSKLQPRKWFRIVVVSEEEYRGYYRVDGDG